MLHNFIIIENGIHDEDIDMESIIRRDEVLDDAGRRSAVDKRMAIAHMLHWRGFESKVQQDYYAFHFVVVCMTQGWTMHM